MDDVYLSDHLAPLLEQLAPAIRRAGLTRRRANLSHGLAFVERAGRLEDGSWAELRFHYRPTEQRLLAGLARYYPLARGGHTRIVGALDVPYGGAPEPVPTGVVEEIAGWLAGLVGAAERELPA